MKIDARSDKVALHYTGNDAGEPAISGVPARDLTENDVDRILYVRHGGQELSGAARDKAVGSLVDELTAGPYRITPPPAEPSADQPKEA